MMIAVKQKIRKCCATNGTKNKKKKFSNIEWGYRKKTWKNFTVCASERCSAVILYQKADYELNCMSCNIVVRILGFAHRRNEFEIISNLKEEKKW